MYSQLIGTHCAKSDWRPCIKYQRHRILGVFVQLAGGMQFRSLLCTPRRNVTFAISGGGGGE